MKFTLQLHLDISYAEKNSMKLFLGLVFYSMWKFLKWPVCPGAICLAALCSTKVFGMWWLWPGGSARCNWLHNNQNNTGQCSANTYRLHDWIELKEYLEGRKLAGSHVQMHLHQIQQLQTGCFDLYWHQSPTLFQTGHNVSSLQVLYQKKERKTLICPVKWGAVAAVSNSQVPGDGGMWGLKSVSPCTRR